MPFRRRKRGTGFDNPAPRFRPLHFNGKTVCTGASADGRFCGGSAPAPRTIEDVINLLKEKYLKEGEQALCNDNDWQMYVADDEWFLTTACCITAPPEFDEETDEEIIPDFAGYLALKEEVKEAEQIRKSVYNILRQEQREQQPRRAQDMER